MGRTQHNNLKHPPRRSVSNSADSTDARNVQQKRKRRSLCGIDINIFPIINNQLKRVIFENVYLTFVFSITKCTFTIYVNCRILNTADVKFERWKNSGNRTIVKSTSNVSRFFYGLRFFRVEKDRFDAVEIIQYFRFIRTVKTKRLLILSCHNDN